jgi:hypothetical protein
MNCYNIYNEFLEIAHNHKNLGLIDPHIFKVHLFKFFNIFTKFRLSNNVGGSVVSSHIQDKINKY